jgi:IclR family KDG regulon transcriptional repressor
MRSDAKKPKSDYSIQTVSNALRLLEIFSEHDELGVSELSRRLGLHKNNIFRLLATLEQSGYIEQSNSTERYRLGAACLELGHAYSRSRSLMRRARPILEDLCETTGETVHLAVLKDFEVVHLDAEQSRQMLLTGTRLGHRLPVHATALGKVLLGCADDSLRDHYDRSLGAGTTLESRTPSTIADRHKLFEHLHTVSVEGYAVDLEECEVGLCCAAAPVRDASGNVVAALSASGPAARLTQEVLHRDVVPTLVSAGDRLSRELGYC